MSVDQTGPLAGTRVLELAGIGPGPFGAMLLADFGADVLRIERPSAAEAIEGYEPRFDVLRRGRRSLLADLKSDEGRELVLRLVERADVLIDPFRPGTLERLGIGPEVVLSRNPRLVFVRVTGWGQTGPWAKVAGHDLDYLALSGVLSSLGRADSSPTPPLNLLADFGGGGMMLVIATCAALLERVSSDRGQVVDVAMVDAVALQYAMILGLLQAGAWNPQRETNALDGGAPFYDTYETADGGFVAIAALEPQFYGELLTRLSLDLGEWPQWERKRWPELREELRRHFRSADRAVWEERLGATETCFAPVLSVEEAAVHPQNVVRQVYVHAGGLLQPSPAPRFGRTPARPPSAPCLPGEGGIEALSDWGISPESIPDGTAA